MTMMSTTNIPGGRSTSTEGAVYPAFDPASNPLIQFAYKVAQARLAKQQQQAQPTAPQPQRDLTPTVTAPRETMADKADQQAREAEARQRIIAAQEASMPPPMKFIPGGPGYTGRYVMDDKAMDSNQRRIYLPQSAGFAQPYAGTGGGGEKPPQGGEDSRDDFEKFKDWSTHPNPVTVTGSGGGGR